MISLKVKLFRIIIKDPPHMEKDLQKVKDSEDWEQFSKKLFFNEKNAKAHIRMLLQGKVERKFQQKMK